MLVSLFIGLRFPVTASYHNNVCVCQENNGVLGKERYCGGEHRGTVSLGHVRAKEGIRRNRRKSLDRELITRLG